MKAIKLSKIQIFTLIVFLFAVIQSSWIITLAKRASVTDDSVKILFIGNSLTSGHDIPERVRSIVQKQVGDVYIESVTPGGYGFTEHAKNTATQQAIHYGKWDYVLLQEQGQRFSFSDEQLEDDTAAAAKVLAKTIRFANPSARIVLYQTFARKFGDPMNCISTEINALCTYAGTQMRINVNTRRLAKELNLVLAPVGEVWLEHLRTYPGQELYEPDGMHANQEGAALAASVIADTIFDGK